MCKLQNLLYFVGLSLFEAILAKMRSQSINQKSHQKSKIVIFFFYSSGTLQQAS